ncbi:unnamed protein product [Cyclocybe aegerita]|uniref:BTB domain-containing protein n=1 Tax=Cyclocybe aegerita TaxID=1973307 RepID=A0A8S0XF62_CYCAE|nr:unnamed protein product [Cyclocybe aegerita]
MGAVEVSTLTQSPALLPALSSPSQVAVTKGVSLRTPPNSPPKLSGKKTPEQPRLRRHRRYYMPDGNVVIQVEHTLFRLDLSVLHENSPILRNLVPPIQSGKLPIIGYNDRRPLVLREIAEADFICLVSLLFPKESNPPKQPAVDDMLSVLKLATSFQMDNIRTTAMNQLHSLPIDPIRKIAIWEEFHLDPDLLLPAYATLCQRSEPLTLSMTMTLGIRNFTKVAASRDYYRQRVGCCGCRKSLSVEESQAIAEEIVQIVFAKRASTGEKPNLLCEADLSTSCMPLR